MFRSKLALNVGPQGLFCRLAVSLDFYKTTRLHVFKPKCSFSHVSGDVGLVPPLSVCLTKPTAGRILLLQVVADFEDLPQTCSDLRVLILRPEPECKFYAPAPEMAAITTPPLLFEAIHAEKEKTPNLI